MATNVRLFGAVVAVAIGALAFKGVDIAQAVAQAATDVGKAAPETALTAGIGDRAPAEPGVSPAPAPEGAPPADAARSGACTPSIDGAAEEMGLSSQDIAVLRSLQQRRRELEDRESTLDTREQASEAAESRLQEQIGSLKTVETNVKALLAKMDAKADERMVQLVKTYESMKPKDAASIFNAMDDQVLLDIAKAMKAATLAPVLSLMQPKRAEQLTQMLADLAKPPAGLDSLPKSPT